MKDGVEPVRAEDVLLACKLADRQTLESDRTLRERFRSLDLLHADFDDLRVGGVERLDPARFDNWRDEVRPA